jgi:hypothetical protein
VRRKGGCLNKWLWWLRGEVEVSRVVEIRLSNRGCGIGGDVGTPDTWMTGIGVPSVFDIVESLRQGFHFLPFYYGSTTT